MAKNEEVFQFWREAKKNQRFNTIFIMARKYLCICSTSCESERLFSTNKNIIGDKRVKLKPQKLENLTFLNKNKDIMNKFSI